MRSYHMFKHSILLTSLSTSIELINDNRATRQIGPDISDALFDRGLAVRGLFTLYYSLKTSTSAP